MNINRPALLLATALLAGAAIPGGARAADALTEDRLARLERIMENQSASSITLQMQQLQQELQELRGLVETQQFELQKLQRQLRDQYLDIDSRLGTAKTPDPSAGANPAAAPAGSPQPTPAAPGGIGASAASPAPTAPQTRSDGAIDLSSKDLRPPVSPETPTPVTAPAPASPRAVGIPSLPSPETTTGNERDAYRGAFELLKQRKYPEAVDAFNDLLRSYPQGQYTDNARYWLAETYYVQRNYPAALAEYDRLVQLNPSSTKVPGAMLKIADIQSEQDAREQARNAYRAVIARFPNSTEARLAQSRLKKLGIEAPR